MSPMLFLPCFLLIFGFICTFSKIPPSKKKLLSLFSSVDLSSNNKPTKKDQSFSGKTDDGSRTAGLRGVFATFDKNSDGFITEEELRESLKNMGISAEESDVAEMVKRVDLNEDGLIDFGEFRQLFESITTAGGGEQENADGRNGADDSVVRDWDLKEAFDVFDGNGDGLITVEELGLVLSSLGFGEGKKMEDCKEMIRRVDIDGDGMVNFDEFKVMMKSGLV